MAWRRAVPLAGGYHIAHLAPAVKSGALSPSAIYAGITWDYCVPSVFLFQVACWHPQKDHLVLITEPLKGHKLPLSAMFCTSPKDLEKPTVGLHFLEMQTIESSCVPALAWCAPRLRTSGRASDDKMALVISTCRFPPHREIPLPSPSCALG